MSAVVGIFALIVLLFPGMNISTAPFAYVMAIAMAVFTIVLFFEAIESFLKIRTGGNADVEK